MPEEIKDAVRGGVLSERDTRVYQGLTAVQQRSLHRARMAGELSQADVRPIARLLREAPDMTVAAATRLLQQAASTDPVAGVSPAPPLPRFPAGEGDSGDTRAADPSGIMPARVGRPTSIERLDWVRGHLARVDRQGLTAAERRELLRLLRLIRDDVASLMKALEGSDE